MEVACCFPWLHSLQWKLGRKWLGHCTLPKCNARLHQRGVWEALQEHCLDHWSLLVLSLQSHYARGSFQFLNGTNEHPDGLRDFPSKLAQSFEHHSCIIPLLYAILQGMQFSTNFTENCSRWVAYNCFPRSGRNKEQLVVIAIGSMKIGHLQHVVVNFVVLLWSTSSFESLCWCFVS